MNYATVIIKPLITEKSLALSQNSTYTFLINPLATKADVRMAMKKVLNVTPLNINITRFRDHKRRINIMDPKKGRVRRKTLNLKKAVVTLQKDEKIDYFDIE